MGVAVVLQFYNEAYEKAVVAGHRLFASTAPASVFRKGATADYLRGHTSLHSQAGVPTFSSNLHAISKFADS